MTTAGKDITIISLILIIVGIVFFWGRSCNQINPALADVAKQSHIADSVKQANGVLVVKVDSIGNKSKSDSAAFRHKIDSMSKRIMVLSDAFSVTKSKLMQTAAKLDSIFTHSDTTVAYSVCQELYNQLTEANNQLFALQISQDSLTTAKDSEIVRVNGQNAMLRGIITTMQGQILTLMETQTNSANDAAKIAKQKTFNGIMAKVGWLVAAVEGLVLLIKK